MRTQTAKLLKAKSKQKGIVIIVYIILSLTFKLKPYTNLYYLRQEYSVFTYLSA